jgi:hypothetical protein
LSAHGIGAIPLDISSYYRNIAAGKLGLPPDKILWYFHEWPVRGKTGVDILKSGTSTLTYQIGPPPCVRINSPGGGANQYKAWCGTVDDSAPRPKIFKAGASSKWWIGGQFALLNTPQATATVGVGMATAAAVTMMLGERGATSAVNFVAYSDAGTPIDSGRAIDTAQHVHAAWRDGANGFYQIDSFAAVSGDIRPSADSCLYETTVDTAVNNHNKDLVWWGAAIPLQ